MLKMLDGRDNQKTEYEPNIMYESYREHRRPNGYNRDLNLVVNGEAVSIPMLDYNNKRLFASAVHSRMPRNAKDSEVEAVVESAWADRYGKE